MKKFNDIMIDIETLGTKSNSVILSIAAIEFDISTGETGNKFYELIDIQSCLDLGLIVEGDTLLWWLSQNDKAKEDLINLPKKSLVYVLELFYKFFGITKYNVWSNSARFDLEIISNAFDKAKLPIPWKWQNERCVRTLYALNPEIKASFKHDGIDHNALSDCFKQIKICSLIWASLGQNK